MKAARPLIYLFMMLLAGCTRDIELDLPDSKPMLVVEGYIEPGLPPYLFLTRSSGFFDKTDSATFAQSFVHNAIVKVSDGINTVELQEFCSSSLPPSLLPAVSAITGYTEQELKTLPICAYVSLNPVIFGQTGRTYTLTINSEGKEYTSVTSIKEPVKLDSLWFKVYGDRDPLGFVNARFSEPAGLNDCYRWMAKRLSKDSRFLAPFGSSFEDKFIDGQTFDFFASRGSEPNSSATDDNNEEAGFFKKGDTVVVKFCTIDFASFNFIRSMETEAANNGNPFAAPTIIPSNINGGALGLWCGYGPYFDTLICK